MTGNQIKFKIWDEKEQKMYSWDGDEPQDELIKIFEDDVDLMGLAFYKRTHRKYLLYSGFKDKNNVEYCDGDIVNVTQFSFKSSGELPEYLVVRLFMGMFQLFRGNECLMGLHVSYIVDGEIVGNIYENPNLIQAPVDGNANA